MKFDIQKVPAIFLWCGVSEFVGKEESLTAVLQISGNIHVVNSQIIDNRSSCALTHPHPYLTSLLIYIFRDKVSFLDLNHGIM